ncbi:MAG: peptidoglycan-binding protein [Sporolactobacillus sp.]
MYPGDALAKSAAIAATFSSSFILLPQYAVAHLINDDAVINKGMHTDDVKTIQSILKATGQYPLTRPTGYFGSSTEKAVKNFQGKNRLSVDGLVGKDTKQALISYVHRQMGLMAEGSSGENVRYLQDFLKQLGYYSGGSDGKFGLATQQAVSSLQRDTSIRVDGIVGNQTWQSIEKLLIAKANGQSVKPSVQKAAPPVVKEDRQSRTSSAPENQAPAETQTTPKTAPVQQVTAVREFYANSTAYTAHCNGCSGKTATGINLIQNPNAKVVAVDPAVIPLGTKLYVEGYGYAVAADTGGAIKGRKIDLYFNDNSDALQWGRKTVKVKVLSN